MSTQQARNIINNQIDNLITRAKTEIKNEGKKKIAERKAQIPTPQTIKEKLKAEISADSCSEKGREKFMKIYNELNNLLTGINGVVGGALEKVTSLEDSIKPIMEEEGPVGQIKGMAEFLNNILQPLNIIILAAPVLLAANSGPTSSGAVTDQVVDKRNKAYSKVKEYMALILCIPIMILYYVKEANKVFIPINLAKSKLTFINEEVKKLILFLNSLLLEFEANCAQFELNNDDNGGIIVIPPTPPTPLEVYLSNLQQQYDDLYNFLKDRGDDKAIERLYTIKATLNGFERDYYTSHKVINL